MLKIINKNTQMALLDTLLSRSQLNDTSVNTVVEEIVSAVKLKKDEAVIAFTRQFDKANIATFRVSDQEIQDAMNEVDPLLIEDLTKARENIAFYHEKQKLSSFEVKKDNGIILGQKVSPIPSVGIYVPGGTAAYPSTVLMNAVPAKIAGVKKIVMVTPPDSLGNINPTILVAAKLAGVDEIYKVGGAQAVAALAFGTESIPKVAKIVGPGNIYVAMAKKMVSGYVGIDLIAGPSELLVIADNSANPTYIACDLMAQAEHDKEAAAILITTSLDLANQVNSALEKEIKTLSRKAIIEASFQNYGAIVIVDSLEEAAMLSNQIAPEHLELLTEDNASVFEQIEHAGSIFLGSYTPEPVGDYFAGPNHTLPTSGTATFSSGLSVLDFIKKSSYTYYSKEALAEAKDSIVRIATSERLTAHARSVSVRFDGGE